MRLLVDTDAFCKLAVAGLFKDAIRLLGADLLECGRLPALPYMLRRGSLPRKYGQDACNALIPIAEAMPVAAKPSDTWLDPLTPVGEIDPGEAQIFAAAAEAGLIVVSGDKRALCALKDVARFPDALAGRIVVLEAILLALCDHIGSNEVQQRVRALAGSDKMIGVCFSIGNPDPREALLSYYQTDTEELGPLVLWDPRSGVET